MPRAGSLTLLRVNVLLAVLGAVMGAIFAVPITVIGHWVSGAPFPLRLQIVIWNSGWFALFGAVLGPVLAWIALRRVPLWKAALGTGLGAIVGGVAGMLVFHSGLFLPLAALGSCLVAWRFQRKYAEPATQRLRSLLTDPDQAPPRLQ